MISTVNSLVQANLGENHPLAEELITKYRTEIESIQFTGKPEDMKKFQDLLLMLGKEIRQLK